MNYDDKGRKIWWTEEVGVMIQIASFKEDEDDSVCRLIITPTIDGTPLDDEATMLYHHADCVPNVHTDFEYCQAVAYNIGHKVLRRMRGIGPKVKVHITKDKLGVPDNL